jgi:hypothetical protein
MIIFTSGYLQNFKYNILKRKSNIRLDRLLWIWEYKYVCVIDSMVIAWCSRICSAAD